ncbi:MAG TPA: ABC transporter ATP-binding protein [Acidimicrobiales bacterium]
MPDAAAPLLDVRDLRVRFATRAGTVHAVDGVSLAVAAGEVVAVVGESGSGKSVTARSVMGLESDVANATVTGEVRFDGQSVLDLTARERRALWSSDIGIVFQNPLTSLNPVLRVGDQITELLRVHRSLSRRDATERAAELLAEVRIPSPRSRLAQYPHELSGGMRQRVAIALAIACGPRLLIADEPTTALDVTVQRQVLDLLAGLTAAHGMATMLITHNLGIAARYADRVLVMYGGRIVETGAADTLFRDAAHPYTQGLVRSIPRLDARRDRPLVPIPGRPPDLRNLPPGCRFAPRCPVAVDRCRTDDPALLPVAAAREAACHLAPGRPEAEAAAAVATTSGTGPAGGGTAGGGSHGSVTATATGEGS